MKKLFIAGLLIPVMLLSGCATIFSGSKQRIYFTSNPSAATIFIDETAVGKTPFSMKLKRNQSREVTISLDGYKPYKTKLTKKFNLWYLGNIMIGGAVGFIIDPITGAMFRLSPTKMNAELNKDLVFNKNKDDIYIAVALEIDPSWQKVGQLERIN